MTLLIVNIGTSDISVKIGDYFIPLGFNRNEPGLQKPEPETPEYEIWDQKEKSIETFSIEELRLSEAHVSKFRYLTQAILDDYDQWHSRIRISRILGVLKTLCQRPDNAIKDDIKVVLIVSDQEEPFPTDTIHAAQIIQRWVERELFAEIPENSPKIIFDSSLTKSWTIKFDPRDEDRVFEHYYDLFREINSDEIVYVSIKGGTQQMAQALRAQAIASNTQAQIFIQPILDVEKILHGAPSDCQQVAYWRYRKAQTYQLVGKLLNRWDFDGADVLLEQWDSTLQFLLDRDVESVAGDSQSLDAEKKKIVKVRKGLQVAVAYFNLDKRAVESKVKGNRELIEIKKYFREVENLYAQCQVYDELNKISDIIYRLGMFYEASQRLLIKYMDGEDYLTNEKDFLLKIEYTQKNNNDLWNFFLERHRECIDAQGWDRDKNRKFTHENYRWDTTKYPHLKLKDRFLKNSFIKALIDNRQNEANDLSLDPWEKLDFWYDARNELVHSVKGIDRDRLQEVYEKENGEEKGACPPDQLLSTMTQILKEVAKVADSPQKESLLRVADSYGVYGKLRDWAIAQLNG
ncbi:MAG: hypothetical protein F6K30_15190 [Cyanothece sp. SIO2G6]|nr:hypothetical protein [Cyanothece sp. SIO2G6]